MGLAVILFTISIRLLMLPITISATRSKKERRDIEDTINQIRHEFHDQPQLQKQRIKKVFRSNRRILVFEAINFFIQLIIFFILYRIFTTGLKGADFHLLYDFMPHITPPLNLTFLGKFDLTHTSFTLNLVQSVTILAVESLSLANSPFPITRGDVVRYIVILPVASFIIFMFLPAGKKLFVITTLWFSFFFTLADILSRVFTRLFESSSPPPPKSPPEPDFSEKPARIPLLYSVLTRHHGIRSFGSRFSR
jgi:membrane protein insertase Oxa1/YidC/SpoIIIJ